MIDLLEFGVIYTFRKLCFVVVGTASGRNEYSIYASFCFCLQILSYGFPQIHAYCWSYLVRWNEVSRSFYLFIMLISKSYLCILVLIIIDLKATLDIFKTTSISKTFFKNLTL